MMAVTLYDTRLSTTEVEIEELCSPSTLSIYPKREGAPEREREITKIIIFNSQAIFIYVCLMFML